MNRVSSNGGTGPPLFTPIRFSDFEVCWAGPNPFRSGFCFGSEDGRLLFTDEDGNALLHGPAQGSASREAINGVARLGPYLAVTTRAEVNFWTFDEKQWDKPPSCVLFPHGAHGIQATAGGSFIAPLGRTGIMAAQPPFDEKHRVMILGGKKEVLNHYRVISLQSGDGQEVLACAARLGGIGSMELHLEQTSHTLRIISAKGLDVVDLCALSTEVGSLAVAAAGRDGTLILIRDVWRDRKPIALKFVDTIEGTVYRLMNAGGDLFLLTSKRLYVLVGLAKRFLAGEPISGISTPVLPIPMEAVDANLCEPRWLLIVQANEVLKFDVGLIRQSAPAGLLVPQSIRPDWQESDIEQTMKSMLEGVA